MANKLNRLKDYFGYSASEKKGILVLFAILLLTITTNILLPFLIKPGSTDFTEFKEKIIAFEKEQMAAADSLNKLRLRKSAISNNEEVILTPFPFDPNQLAFEDWKKLGLNDWQIKVIKNFESKGGRFYRPEDLAKMYSISEQEYKILKPYIRIAKKSKDDSKKIITPFPFDPNTVSKEELLSMNIRENLVKAIVNYRNKGGKFYRKEDLQKIYTISEEEFAVLEPFILIDTNSNQIAINEFKTTDSLIIELNTADSLDLQQLKGIGPSYAKRIIKYRDLLGGYNNVNQLMEVYGMDKNRFDGIKNHILINKDIVLKINVNQTTIKELIKHPYIEFYVAKSIITHRNKIGSYNNLEEIKDAALVYEELYQKIIPYLKIN